MLVCKETKDVLPSNHSVTLKLFCFSVSSLTAIARGQVPTAHPITNTPKKVPVCQKMWWITTIKQYFMSPSWLQAAEPFKFVRESSSLCLFLSPLSSPFLSDESHSVPNTETHSDPKTHINTLESLLIKSRYIESVLVYSLFWLEYKNSTLSGNETFLHIFQIKEWKQRHVAVISVHIIFHSTSP